MNYNRRDILRLGLGSVIMSAASAAPFAFAEDGKKIIPVCLQMWSVRNDFKANPAKVLEAIAKMGYDGVEYAHNYPLPIKELAKLQKDFGLTCTGSHLGRNDVEDPEALKRAIENHQILGGKFILCAWMRNDTEEDWIKAAEKFSKSAEIAKEAGMYVGYHAHEHDFNKLPNGLTTWEIFADHSSNDVQLQMDTSNCPDNPYYFMEKYPGRCKTVHMKEKDLKIIGEGTIDFKRVIEFCETKGGVENYTIEYEGKNPMVSVDLCKQAFEKIRKSK